METSSAIGAPAEHSLFDRAVALAKQRAQLLELANHPDAWTMKADPQLGPTTRRQLLVRARKVEKIIVRIAEVSMLQVRYSA